MVMTYSRAKVQGQQSVGSKDNSQKKWTDRWTEASAVTSLLIWFVKMQNNPSMMTNFTYSSPCTENNLYAEVSISYLWTAICSVAVHLVDLDDRTPETLLSVACWQYKFCLNKLMRPSGHVLEIRHVTRLLSCRSSNHFCTHTTAALMTLQHANTKCTASIMWHCTCM